MYIHGRGVGNTANNMGNGVVDSFSNLGKSLFPWLRAPEATASQQSKPVLSSSSSSSFSSSSHCSST